MAFYFMFSRNTTRTNNWNIIYTFRTLIFYLIKKMLLHYTVCSQCLMQYNAEIPVLLRPTKMEESWSSSWRKVGVLLGGKLEFFLEELWSSSWRKVGVLLGGNMFMTTEEGTQNRRGNIFRSWLFKRSFLICSLIRRKRLFNWRRMNI